MKHSITLNLLILSLNRIAYNLFEVASPEDRIALNAIIQELTKLSGTIADEYNYN